MPQDRHRPAGTAAVAAEGGRMAKRNPGAGRTKRAASLKSRPARKSRAPGRKSLSRHPTRYNFAL